jgi:hypothetical protein
MTSTLWCNAIPLILAVVVWKFLERVRDWAREENRRGD